jgi:hypothetical protein
MKVEMEKYPPADVLGDCVIFSFWLFKPVTWIIKKYFDHIFH